MALPLAVLQVQAPAWWLAVAAPYVILLGGTHFLITLGVYLNPANRRYFASSPARITTYFVAPVLLLGSFFLINYLRLNVSRPGDTLGFVVWVFFFTIAVRAADFTHVVRQSFGVLQLFKAQSGARFPAWMRRADNAFFVGMAGLQWWTFVRGVRTGAFTFSLDSVTFVLLAIVMVALVGTLAGFLVAARQGGVDSLAVPLGYFACQAVSASLPAWHSELYTASLAMHYVEYHIIIFPRLFAEPTAPVAATDRLDTWVRRHKLVFYGVLAVIAVFVARDLLWVPVSSAVGDRRDLWLLFNLFSGIFVTHYFIEAFIWKFRNPYYRDALVPLYFPTSPSRK